MKKAAAAKPVEFCGSFPPPRSLFSDSSIFDRHIFSVLIFSCCFCFLLFFAVSPVSSQESEECANGVGSSCEGQDPASLQLEAFRQRNVNNARQVMTTSFGVPIETRTAVLTVGERGPMLLQDTVYLDELFEFDRERIPERVVHAKGAAAFGQFVVTHDITNYSKASIFAKIGKQTPCLFRFSTVAGERGSADTLRDPRGFAMKYYTDEGNWDLVGNNSPIFFIRDPLLFPSFIHSQKRNPVTNLHDPNMVWDFFSLRPESMNMLMRIFSDLGTPDGFRKMHGFGTNTFKLVNANGTAVYCKFKLESLQGVHNLTAQRAAQLASEDPDYSTRDLFNAIERKDFPKWDFKIQVMTFEQAANYRFNPFDATKTWSEKEFPLIPVGQVTLNRNPSNYFLEVEQAAFDPARIVLGVEASPDKLLQGRLFSYQDTHTHRLGSNHLLLPVNQPVRPAQNTQRDGFARSGKNAGGTPNYFPNSFGGPQPSGRSARESRFSVGEHAIVGRYETGDEDNYSQPADMFNNQLDAGARRRLAQNIAASLGLALPRIQSKMLGEFGKVSKVLERMVGEELKKRRRLS